MQFTQRRSALQTGIFLHTSVAGETEKSVSQLSKKQHILRTSQIAASSGCVPKISASCSRFTNLHADLATPKAPSETSEADFATAPEAYIAFLQESPDAGSAFCEKVWTRAEHFASASVKLCLDSDAAEHSDTFQIEFGAMCFDSLRQLTGNSVKMTRLFEGIGEK